MTDVRCFRDDRDADYCLVIAQVRKTLSEIKRMKENLDTEQLNIHKLNDMEVREQHQVKISNRFATLNVFNNISSSYPPLLFLAM
jgi:hypothetical protein